MTTQRDLLDREIGTPPPSTIDIDALITRQRRGGRLRTAGLGALVLAMVLAIGAVLVVLRGPGGMQWDRNVAASPTPTVVQPAPGSRAAEAARLTAVLQQLVSQALPGATLAKAPPGMPGEQAGDPLVFVDHGTHFEAAAVVTDAAGVGTIRVSVGKEETQFRADHECMTDPAPLDVIFNCEVVPAAGGANIMKITTDIGNEQYRRYNVEIIRVDGNAVSVDVSNGVLDSGGPYRGQRPQPLLTMDQATAFVQEPTLATTLA